MDVGEVPREGNADVVVNQVMRISVPVDANHTSLGFTVLIVPERDCHNSTPSVGGIGEGRQQERDVIVGAWV